MCRTKTQMEADSGMFRTLKMFRMNLKKFWTGRRLRHLQSRLNRKIKSRKDLQKQLPLSRKLDRIMIKLNK